jgi:hypothetical protein
MTERSGVSSFGNVEVPNNESKRSIAEEIGPGIWHVMHTLAIAAHSVQEQRHFVDVVNKVCYSFPCEACREHCVQYISTFPPDNAVGVYHGAVPGMFVWSWEFHNSVNQRLHKPLVSLQQAVAKYSRSGEVCRDCVQPAWNKRLAFNPVVAPNQGLRIIGRDR